MMRVLVLCVALAWFGAACAQDTTSSAPLELGAPSQTEPTYEYTPPPEYTPPVVVATRTATRRSTKPSTKKAPARRCHPNYTGACLKPDSPDYDCAGGSGNGPDYVQGPVYVHGADPYGLDRDGNGVGCE